MFELGTVERYEIQRRRGGGMGASTSPTIRARPNGGDQGVRWRSRLPDAREILAEACCCRTESSQHRHGVRLR